MTTTVEISATLKALVEELVDSVKNTKELVEKVERQAEEDGLSNKELRELIKTVAERRGLSDRQTFRLLPDSTKDPQKVKAGLTPKKGADIMSADNSRTTTPKATNTTAVALNSGDHYKDDAGNDPELVSKYVNTPEGATTQWQRQAKAQQEIRLDVKKWWSVIEAHMPTKTLIFIVEDDEVVDVRGGSVRGEPL